MSNVTIGDDGMVGVVRSKVCELMGLEVKLYVAVG